MDISLLYLFIGGCLLLHVLQFLPHEKHLMAWKRLHNLMRQHFPMNSKAMTTLVNHITTRSAQSMPPFSPWSPAFTVFTHVHILSQPSDFVSLNALSLERKKNELIDARREFTFICSSLPYPRPRPRKREHTRNRQKRRGRVKERKKNMAFR